MGDSYLLSNDPLSGLILMNFRSRCTRISLDLCTLMTTPYSTVLLEACQYHEYTFVSYRILFTFIVGAAQPCSACAAFQEHTGDPEKKDFQQIDSLGTRPCCHKCTFIETQHFGTSNVFPPTREPMSIRCYIACSALQPPGF